MSGYLRLRYAGLRAHLEALSESGCVYGCDPAGHRWVPERELPEGHPAREVMGWSYSQDCPLIEAEWALNPYCTKCRAEARKWMAARGMLRKEWRAIYEIFGLKLPKARNEDGPLTA